MTMITAREQIDTGDLTGEAREARRARIRRAIAKEQAVLDRLDAYDRGQPLTPREAEAVRRLVLDANGFDVLASDEERFTWVISLSEVG
jgi:hypothetical protein